MDVDIPDYVNIEIGDLPLLSQITPTEAFQRYETKIVKMTDGSCTHHQGEIILREFTFKTSLDIPLEKPNIHYKVIKDLMKEPVKIVCPEIDAYFLGMVVFKPVRDSPTSIEFDVNVKEVPEKK